MKYSTVLAVGLFAKLSLPHLLAVVPVIVLLFMPLRVDADIVTISDQTFVESDWTATVVHATDATHSFNQPLAGGNPGAYREMTHELNSTGSTIRIFHEHTGFNYNPSLQGAIASLDYSEDNLRFDPPGGNIGANPGLIQDGIIFFGPYFVFSNSSWETTAMNELDFADFSDGVNNPNFSITGSEIRFGFVRSNTTSNPNGISRQHGIDNWTFALTTNAIPEPNAFMSTILALTVIAMRCFRPKFV